MARRPHVGSWWRTTRGIADSMMPRSPTNIGLLGRFLLILEMLGETSGAARIRTDDDGAGQPEADGTWGASDLFVRHPWAFSSRESHALAMRQSRSTVLGETPSASAVSSTVMPAKTRISTMRA